MSIAKKILFRSEAQASLFYNFLKAFAILPLLFIHLSPAQDFNTFNQDYISGLKKIDFVYDDQPNAYNEQTDYSDDQPDYSDDQPDYSDDQPNAYNEQPDYSDDQPSDYSFSTDHCESLNLKKIKREDDQSAEYAFQAANQYADLDCFEISIPWYEKAIQKGHTEAQYRLGQQLLFLNNREEYYNGGQVTDLPYILELLSAAANSNHTQSQNLLANIYLFGENYGMDTETDRAAYWFQQAAENNHADSQYELAALKYYGIGAPQNYNQMISLLEQATQQNQYDAQHVLAVIYFNGLKDKSASTQKDIVKQDYDKAKVLLESLLESDYRFSFPEIYLKLASIYYDGLGSTVKNQSKAFSLYKFAACAGLKEAQLALAGLYYQGLGTTQDILEAMQWMNHYSNNFTHATMTYKLKACKSIYDNTL